MGVYKKDNRWYIDYYLPDGSRKRETVKIPGVDPSKITRQDALKAHTIRKAQIAEGKFQIVQTRKPIPFEKLADRYLDYSKANKRAWLRDHSSLNHLRACFKNKTLPQITPWLIEKYKAERKNQVKPSTVNRELDTLRNMLNKAVIWKMIDSSPFKGVKLFRVSNTNLRILSDDEFQKLYAVASSELKPILLTAISTGMRLGETLSLKWEDVSLKADGYITVRDSKNYESRTITLHPTLRETLIKLKAESQSEYVFEGRKTVKRAWQKALRLSKIPHCRFHDLRHTFASRLVMAGVDLVTVAELMGHKDITMTKRYSHPTPEHKKQAIERINLAGIDTYLDTKTTFQDVKEEKVSNLSDGNQKEKEWSGWPDLNRRPLRPERNALPTELHPELYLNLL